MKDAAQRRLLRVAIKRLGFEVLAARLHTSADQIDEWLKPDVKMPDRKFVGLVNLLEEVGALGDPEPSGAGPRRGKRRDE